MHALSLHAAGSRQRLQPGGPCNLDHALPGRSSFSDLGQAVSSEMPALAVDYLLSQTAHIFEPFNSQAPSSPPPSGLFLLSFSFFIYNAGIVFPFVPLAELQRVYGPGPSSLLSFNALTPSASLSTNGLVPLFSNQLFQFLSAFLLFGKRKITSRSRCI
jgi:hypothetical protein